MDYFEVDIWFHIWLSQTNTSIARPSILENMALNVSIKHSGKAYDVRLDPSLPPSAFKQSIYEVTGVPPDRMKVMIKGGYLK